MIAKHSLRRLQAQVHGVRPVCHRLLSVTAFCLSCDNNFTTTGNFVVGLNGEQLDELNASGAVYSNVFANGQLLATYQFSTPNWTYALNDWLGTKRVVANSNGTQAESCTGQPFGDNLHCTGTGGDPSPQHFTGKERDTESNNDYFGARYYSSNTGRFLSPDWSNDPDPVPYADLENPQSLNLYGYVNNNPLSKTDADGHFMLVIDERLVGTQQCWCEQLSSDLLSFWYHIQWNWQNNPNIWDRAYWSKSNKPAPPPAVPVPTQTANPNPDDKNDKKDDQNNKKTDHAKERQEQAREGDAHRDVGDANRTTRQGRHFTDTETGYNVHVRGNRVVITDPSDGDAQVTQFKTTSSKTQANIESGKWQPQ
jgi:RHS repeat-associated protein